MPTLPLARPPHPADADRLAESLARLVPSLAPGGAILAEAVNSRPRPQRRRRRHGAMQQRHNIPLEFPSTRQRP